MAPNYPVGKETLAGLTRCCKGQIVGEIYNAVSMAIRRKAERKGSRRTLPPAAFAL